ncbi:MAG: glutamyl-tRNA reductase [Methanoculleaceae archaeon]
MNTSEELPLALATLNHHTSTVEELERNRFEDEREALTEICSSVRGVVLLQTCNRIEILVHGDAEKLEEFLEETGRFGFSIISGDDVVRHLMELAGGLDSMIIGEDQILGQMKNALASARDAGTSSPLLERAVMTAVHVGSTVRRQTRINQGAVSIGSAAVELAESLLGSLQDRHILVVGSGEMGQLVAQALASRNLSAIYVTNRTYHRAVALARKIGGRAVDFHDLYHYITLSDVVISCTAAPHPVIHTDRLAEAMCNRRWPLDSGPAPLIIIDIAQPRDVEKEAGDIEGVHLFTIDSLRSISERNMEERKVRVEEARSYIEQEMDRAIRLLKRTAAGDALAQLYTWAEAIRTRERDRALNRLMTADERTAEVIDDLSRVLVNKLLADITKSIRISAENGDLEAVESVIKSLTQGKELCFRRND